ncbi:hypothetical protein YC2023_104757 [Brassica napus]
MVELRSSSDVVATNPTQTQSTDDGRADEASTSRGQEPASTELGEPPPPGGKTKKPNKELHHAFLNTTAPLLQRQNRHRRSCSRTQARRRREETRAK